MYHESWAQRFGRFQEKYSKMLISGVSEAKVWGFGFGASSVWIHEPVLPAEGLIKLRACQRLNYVAPAHDQALNLGNLSNFYLIVGASLEQLKSRIRMSALILEDVPRKALNSQRQTPETAEP